MEKCPVKGVRGGASSFRTQRVQYQSTLRHISRFQCNTMLFKYGSKLKYINCDNTAPSFLNTIPDLFRAGLWAHKKGSRVPGIITTRPRGTWAVFRGVRKGRNNPFPRIPRLRGSFTFTYRTQRRSDRVSSLPSGVQVPCRFVVGENKCPSQKYPFLL